MAGLEGVKTLYKGGRVGGSLLMFMYASDCVLHFATGGTLLVRKDVLPGYKYLNITIEKIELKDAETYFDPFITVSVKSKW